MASQQQGRRPIYQLGVPGYSVVQSYHGWPIHTYINLAEYSVVGTSRGQKSFISTRGVPDVQSLKWAGGQKLEVSPVGFRRLEHSRNATIATLKGHLLCINPIFGASRGEKLKAMIAFQQLCLHGKSKKSE